MFYTNDLQSSQHFGPIEIYVKRQGSDTNLVFGVTKFRAIFHVSRGETSACEVDSGM